MRHGVPQPRQEQGDFLSNPVWFRDVMTWHHLCVCRGQNIL